ncbi:MAG: nitrile hydratase accessory protein [Alphaproteobacteria bacterium]|nr:MAG: nitrile hydratase accessory protein [Alphaproteobacteria bacterium]
MSARPVTPAQVSIPDDPALRPLPRDEGGPVFQEPWQAQAFALTVRLIEAGVFTWADWATALGAEIRAAQAAGDPDLGDTYYRHWVAALERLVARKRLLSPDQMSARTAAWARAYRETPHGRPVSLRPEAGQAGTGRPGASHPGADDADAS